MRCLVQALVLIALAAEARAIQESSVTAPAPAEAALAQRVRELVLRLGSDRRAQRLDAQLELLALGEDAAPLLDEAEPPTGFEAHAALEYVRSHRARASRPVEIPAGAYAIGSELPFDRNPRREVKLAAYRIDDVEVTCFEYFRFVRETGTSAPPDWDGGRYRFGEERFPVGDVAPEEAARFAAWAGGRLPTTVEWEVAGHLGEPWAYPWGATYLPLASAQGRLAPVGSDPQDRSPAGCFDLAGSLMEWVTLGDGQVAARGGYFKSGQREFFRITRAADPRFAFRLPSIGFRVVNRSR